MLKDFRIKKPLEDDEIDADESFNEANNDKEASDYRPTTSFEVVNGLAEAPIEPEGEMWGDAASNATEDILADAFAAENDSDYDREFEYITDLLDDEPNLNNDSFDIFESGYDEGIKTTNLADEEFDMDMGSDVSGNSTNSSSNSMDSNVDNASEI